MNNNNLVKLGNLFQILNGMKSKLELSLTERNAISKLSSSGTGDKVLADNGEYIESYRTMTNLEVSSLVSSILQ